jgi:hypothetical protein
MPADAQPKAEAIDVTGFTPVTAYVVKKGAGAK